MKKLIINKANPNGIIEDMTPEEIAEMQKDIPSLPYEQRIVNRIRERYSMDDELALHRKADIALYYGYSLPTEFIEYHDFVEQIKYEERGKE